MNTNNSFTIDRHLEALEHELHLLKNGCDTPSLEKVAELRKQVKSIKNRLRSGHECAECIR